MPETVDFIRPAELRAALRRLAVVQLLFHKRQPDSWFRLESDGITAVAGWNDFVGNTCHFLFSPAGNVLLGFDHESPMSPHAGEKPDVFEAWPGVYDSLPEPLMKAVEANPFGEFDPQEVTLCLWNKTATKTWQKGDIEYPDCDHGSPDGQGYLLSWFREYVENFGGKLSDQYGWEIDDDAAAELLAGDKITRNCLTTLKPGCRVTDLIPHLEAMGYRID